ncbi:hypothetical protein [Burkholderia pseudomultivorans]|uniref:hypothetical protein n=1 Tax=Burkholderia pseudomultivorans TaxID=1207504 RepID=UPI001581724B|nr:hypothetical protein [Burkholderia pseudomultivorans]
MRRLTEEEDIGGSTFRAERDEEFDKVWRAGERACPDCLRETLKRSGLINDDATA